MTAYYDEPAKRLPVHTSCDVLVIGGGTAGLIAALASARTGADTVLIERYGFLGGTMHCGVCGVHSFFNNHQAYGRERKQLVQGIPGEVAQRMIEAGACPGHIDQVQGYEHFDTVTTFDREYFKQLAFNMARESGVRLMMHTLMADVIMNGSSLAGVIVESKNGREAIFSKQIVDCSGDGDAAFRAGCEFFEDPDPYPVGMLFAMANVDLKRLVDFLTEKQVLEHLALVPQTQKADQFIRIATNFAGNTELKAMANSLGIWGLYAFSCNEGELTYLNGSRAEPLKDLSPEELTRAEIETRQNVMRMAEVFKKHLPGFEHAYITWTSPQIGIRRTRVVSCEYELTGENVLNCDRFSDEIGLYGFEDLAPKKAIQNGGWYGIPYRALLPKKIDNLLVAGRMITLDKVAHMSTRNSACCMLQGQAAGTAAALCSREGIAPRALNPGHLREHLDKDGVCLH